jgi:nucleoside-diphosphate-sugar epimerase
MKALVTGGAGFIGSHIAQGLCAKGAKVIVLDNLSLGVADNLDWKLPGDQLELVVGDVADEMLVNDLVKGCDWVFHQAALPSVPLSVEKPLETNEQNLSASLRLLIAARDAGVRRFLFASSSAIYGDSDSPAKRETDLPNPMSPYALQKFASERYAQLFFRLYGLETVSFRYFNIFGQRQSFNSQYSGVIARFCTSFLAGKRPTVFGDGKQSRDFTAVANVVRANILAAEAPAGKVAGKVFNVGAGESINLLQLIEQLNLLTGRDIVPTFEPSRPGDVRTSKADISVAIDAFGYSVQTSWLQGLKETLEFYRKQ